MDLLATHLTSGAIGTFLGFGKRRDTVLSLVLIASVYISRCQKGLGLLLGAVLILLTRARRVERRCGPDEERQHLASTSRFPDGQTRVGPQPPSHRTLPHSGQFSWEAAG